MRISTHRSFIAVIVLTFTAVLGCNNDKGPSGGPVINQGNPPAARSDSPAPQRNAEGVNYFADAQSVRAKLEAKVGGPVRLLELAVYPGYVIAQIQDPKKRENVDEYELRGGEVSDGAPIKFSGNAPSAEDLDAATIDIASVDIAAVPKMAKDAMAQLNIEGGKVSHVVLKRNRPFSDDVQWRIFVSGPRRNGTVDFDSAGKMKKTGS